MLLFVFKQQAPVGSEQPDEHLQLAGPALTEGCYQLLLRLTGSFKRRFNQSSTLT